MSLIQSCPEIVDSPGPVLPPPSFAGLRGPHSAPLGFDLGRRDVVEVLVVALGLYKPFTFSAIVLGTFLDREELVDLIAGEVSV